MLLLETKLSPPQLPRRIVERERLVEWLDGVYECRLGVVAARAGSGKTTMVAEWVRRQRAMGRAVAWVSLEESENDIVRFWSYVIAALRMCEPEVGGVALSMLQAPQRPEIAKMLTVLINELMGKSQEIVLVLDDYHVIEDGEVMRSLQFWVEHMPERMHVLMVGRGEPALSLARLRARGQVLEIGEGDLRFTQAETGEFLRQGMGVALGEAEVEVLNERVEGWVAGLQLAGLALRSRGDVSIFVRELSGKQRFILEYLRDEVVEQLPEDMLQFLLETAVLTRLQASLCCAVMDRGSEQECWKMLVRLEQGHLFVQPLDEERNWYRVHGLLRDVLLTRLQEVAAERVYVLHRRAAYWYREQGDVREAIGYALEGKDYAFAADLMEEIAGYMRLNGEIEQLLIWLRSLPDSMCVLHGRLVLSTVLQRLLQGLYENEGRWRVLVKEAEELIVRVEVGLQGGEWSGGKEVLRRRVEMLRLWIKSREAVLHGDVVRIREFGERLGELGREEEVVWKVLAMYHIAASEERAERMLPMLLALREQAMGEGHGYEEVWVTERLGGVYRDRGRVREAYEMLGLALQRLYELGKARSLFGYVHLQLAELDWVGKRYEEARRHVEEALQFGRLWSHVNIVITGCYRAVCVLLAQGKVSEAEDVLREIGGMGEVMQWRHQRCLVRAARLLVWLAKGDRDRVAEWVAGHQVEVSESGPIEDAEYAEAMALVRGLVMLRRYGEALSWVERLRVRAEECEHVWYVGQVRELEEWVRSVVGKGREARGWGLTRREEEVLRLLVKGRTNGEIAEELVVSLATAKKHVANILNKLGVENRGQAIARAHEGVAGLRKRNPS